MDTSISNLMTGMLLLTMPTVLLIAALPHAGRNAASARRYRKRVTVTASGTLLLAFLACLTYALGARDGLVVASVPIPIIETPFALSVQVDVLTLVLATLVSFIVTIIANYSAQYLDGDPDQARFCRLLSVTAGLFMLVVIAGNMGLFTLGITATGFSLHRLLQFYPQRPRAIMATHKKALFSRAADACLVLASILVGHQVGSLQFDAIEHYVLHIGTLPPQLQVAAWLIVVAAILKSAQFPFHGWLIQVMEAPTPVSALMHAGVVYSGAIIVLRTSELLSNAHAALTLLAIIGLLTLLIASLVMLTQTAIKSSLAWSTTAQLGFMLFELGMGLFALALLHLVGHSLYKAHAFLSSGSMVDNLRQIRRPSVRTLTPLRWLAGVGLSVALSVLTALSMGIDITAEPALIALTAIVALAVAQIIIKVLGFGSSLEIAGAAVIAAGMALCYFALHQIFVYAFADVLAPIPTTMAPEYAALTALVIATFLLLTWLQGPGRERLEPTRQMALFVHLYNGLYADLWIERLSYRLWPDKVGKRTHRFDLAVARTAPAALSDKP